MAIVVGDVVVVAIVADDFVEAISFDDVDIGAIS